MIAITINVEILKVRNFLNATLMSMNDDFRWVSYQ